MTRPSTIDLRWGSASHPGCVRPHNEDALLAGPAVFAVADGMGGHAGGDVASGMAVAGLARLDGLDRGADPEGALTVALEEINDLIRSRASVIGADGMGTTVAGFAPAGEGDVVVFNLGDTRVYRCHEGTLGQLTVDHSVVGELVRAGELTADEARVDPRRNIVTRALGVEAPVVPQVRRVRVEVGDSLIIASDGLYVEVSEDHLLELSNADLTAEHRATAMLEAALDAGARDNVSVVVVDVTGTGTVDHDDLGDDTRPRAEWSMLAGG